MMNPADGVGSLKHDPERIRPTRKVAWCITVLTATAKMEIPDHKCLIRPVLLAF